MAKAKAKQEYKTVAEIAELCRCTKLTVYRWIKNDDMPVHRIGRRILIDMNEFQKYMDDKTEAQRNKTGQQLNSAITWDKMRKQ